MTRRFYIHATMLAASGCAAAFAAVAVMHPLPRLLWNASASAPIGLYSLTPDRDAPLGALVAVAPPEQLARWMAERRYLAMGVPLLKHIAAKGGQRICRSGDVVSVNARRLAIARARDSRCRPLPVWQGCRRLAEGELLLVNPAVPDSLDGRYFGPLPASALLGRATPILTRDAPGAPLVWR